MSISLCNFARKNKRLRIKSTGIMARPRVKKILLSDDQVRELKKVLKSAKVCDTVKCRCRVLLDLDMKHGTQYTYEQCANRHGMSKTTVRSVIDTFSSGGLNAVKREQDAWECEKNNEEKKVIWQFRTKDARIKLASLYPKLG